MSGDQVRLSLAALAEAAGVPGRTIRFYIARGMLAGPSKAGRGATYGADHLERLREIGRLQAEGLTLREIGLRLARGEEPGAAVPEPAVWWRYQLAEDVVVQVRGDASPWRLKRVRRELERMTAALQASERTENR